ncbi:MAG: tetratricopeptide repeat protein [Deltaproteobacteria bacterium]|nr:tetratricopeptide repeat protein [Deltaproteobacteria bacterium]
MKIFAVFSMLLLCLLTTPNVDGQDTPAPETSILESQVLVRQGDGQKARAVLEDGLRVFPGEPRLYLHLGDVYQTLDQPRDALEAYRAAVNLHPGYIRAYEQMAAVSRNLREWAEAINAYEKIAAIDPSAAAPWFEMAMIYRAQGFVDQEKMALSEAWRRNADYVVKAALLKNFEIDALSLQARAKEESNSVDGAQSGKKTITPDEQINAPNSVNSHYPGETVQSPGTDTVSNKKEEVVSGYGAALTAGAAVVLLGLAFMLGWKKRRG